MMLRRSEGNASYIDSTRHFNRSTLFLMCACCSFCLSCFRLLLILQERHELTTRPVAVSVMNS